MKKIVLISLLFLVFILLISCTSENNINNSNETIPSSNNEGITSNSLFSNNNENNTTTEELTITVEEKEVTELIVGECFDLMYYIGKEAPENKKFRVMDKVYEIKNPVMYETNTGKPYNSIRLTINDVHTRLISETNPHYINKELWLSLRKIHNNNTATWCFEKREPKKEEEKKEEKIYVNSDCTETYEIEEMESKNFIIEGKEYDINYLIHAVKDGKSRSQFIINHKVTYSIEDPGEYVINDKIVMEIRDIKLDDKEEKDIAIICFRKIENKDYTNSDCTEEFRLGSGDRKKVYFKSGSYQIQNHSALICNPEFCDEVIEPYATFKIDEGEEILLFIGDTHKINNNIEVKVLKIEELELMEGMPDFYTTICFNKIS